MSENSADRLTGILKYESSSESEKRLRLLTQLQNTTIPNDQILENLGLFLDSKNLSRLLFLDFMYQKILETPGQILDLGTRWGQNAGVFSALRGIYEPYNRHRHIVAFDTFSGFPDVDSMDGKSNLMKQGNLATTSEYDSELNQILETKESLDPLSHITKFSLVKGDVTTTISDYLETNPHTIIALAYFDFDLFSPTKLVLEKILPRITKGSVLVFDELNDPDSPGETLALIDSLGITNLRLKKPRYASRVSYCVWGE